MKQRFTFLALLFVLATGCSVLTNGNSNAHLTGAALYPFRRFRITAEQHLELISSGVHAGFSFEGKECFLSLCLADKGAHNYLQYRLDGAYKKKNPDQWKFK